MKTLKTLIPIAVLLTVLASAVAMWSETLLINVTVKTGEVDVEFSDWFCTDEGPDPQAEGFSNEEGKNVAKCLIEEEEHDEEGDVIKLNVTLSNVYPGYAVNVTLKIHNIGTVPVKLYKHSVEFDDPIEYELIIPEDTHIEPCEISEYILEITIPQEAEENEEYDGEVELVFAQWNEVE